MTSPESVTINFSAVKEIISKAHEGPITQEDFVPLAECMQGAVLVKRFDAMMRRIVWRVPIGRGGASSAEKKEEGEQFRILDENSLTQPAIDDLVENHTTDRVRLYLSQGHSLFFLLVRFIGDDIALAFIFGFIKSCAIVLQIWALWTLVRVANGDPDYDYSSGVQYVIALLLPLGSYVQATSQQNCFHVSTRAALKMRLVATGIIFEKVKVMTPLAMGEVAETEDDSKEEGKSVEGEAKKKTKQSKKNKKTKKNKEPKSTELVKNEPSSKTDTVKGRGTSSGQLLNFVSSDANTVIETVIISPVSLASAVDMCSCVAWIGWVAGWAAAPLSGAITLIFLFQMYCGKRVSATRTLVGAVIDQRLRSLSEFLQGIQVVKFYAWEQNVRGMINSIRSAEGLLHITSNIWRFFGLATMFFASGVFALVVFACKLTYDNTMEPAETFVIMTLVGFISRTFEMLPRTITCIGTAMASMNRIESFIQQDVMSGLPVVEHQEGEKKNAAKTIDTDPFAHESDGSFGADGIEMRTTDQNECEEKKKKLRGLHIVGDFGWSGFAVRDINLFCPQGSLTVIIGTVGSGKSTLLQAVLGVCGALSPTYRIRLPPPLSSAAGAKKSTIAYVAQEAFIYDATVRDNITFGLPYDEAKYRAVLKACSLVTDIKQWGGDLVEVTGGTLSGGQRQRISLARACYADADLYIVDDPISAVDAAVGNHLLNRCFRGYLKGKTILLATHHPAPARFADQVVVMEKGTANVCIVSQETEAIVRQVTSEHPEVLLDEGHAATEASVQDVIRHMQEENDEAAGVSAFNDADSIDRVHTALLSPLVDSEVDATATSIVGSDAEWDAILDALIGQTRQLRELEVEGHGSVSLDVYKAYIKGGGVGLCALTLFLFVVSQGVRTVQDWWFSAWTRKEYANLSNDQSLYILGILVGLMIVFGFARAAVFGFFTIEASSSLHNRMFEAVIASPLHFFEQVPIGRIMNRFSKDLDYCDDLLPGTIFDVLQLLLLVMGSLALLVYAIPWFAIAIPVALVVFGYLVRTYMPASRFIKRVEGTSRSPTMNTFQTFLNGLTTLRVYNRLDYFEELFFSYSDITTNAILHSQVAQRWMGIRMDWVCTCWVLIVAILAVALQDDLGPSLVGLCLSQSLSITSILQYAIRMVAETENLMTSAERLHEYSQLPPEENEGTLAPPAKGEVAVVVPPSDDKASDGISSAPLQSNWPEDCDIKVKGLTMAYRSNPNLPVLKNLHFTIRAGQRVAVVGRTGAGKSSLLAAFYRTAPTPHGAIAIGGVPTTAMDVFAMRARLGIIPQVPTLFHGSFRYNLDPFGQYADSAMLEALKKVRLDTFVAARQGLDTHVGDNGASLSVGQRQLLCAARVLLTKPSILFMDEATANIDEATDEQIQQIMREEASSRRMTIVTIAHRLNTIMDYDLVLVMSQGRLVEYGKPADLARRRGGNDDDTSSVAVTQHIKSSIAEATQSLSNEDFTVNIESEDEVGLFARMVVAMHAAHDGC